MSVTACDDDNKTSFGKAGRKESRKRSKVSKNEENDIETGQVSP